MLRAALFVGLLGMLTLSGCKAEPPPAPAEPPFEMTDPECRDWAIRLCLHKHPDQGKQYEPCQKRVYGECLARRG